MHRAHVSHTTRVRRNYPIRSDRWLARVLTDMVPVEPISHRLRDLAGSD